VNAVGRSLQKQIKTALVQGEAETELRALLNFEPAEGHGGY
jgi:hypothetical protein